MDTPKPRLPLSLAAFVVLYMLAFGVVALVQRNAEFVIYEGSMIVFIAVVLVLHRTVVFRASTLWMLAFWGFFHLAGGTVPIPADLAQTDATHTVLYSLRPWADLPRYDQVTHAFGFFSATLACHDAIVAFAGRPNPAPKMLAVAAALMGMGLGAINEVLEFAVQLTLPETNVGGYVNTGWDLVSNTIGAIAAATARIIAPPAPTSAAP
ncbi:MAG: hypothetical protein DHS20C14_20920 [Phycisphaeraceae bacterium]|nr:MAG: hypothetical protein DHS20C14_20920 [Phycisphaeraceae bacterium]